MNEPCAKITLDVQQSSTATFVAVKRGDIGRKIVISLSDGGFPYEIAADCYAVLTGTKPDGNILYNHCGIEGNTIVYEITEQTTAAAGRIKAEVKLYSSEDTIVTSATFRIIVDGTVYVDDQVESSSEFSALSELIAQALALLQNGTGDSSGSGIATLVVSQLPTEDISSTTIYLVPDGDEESNIYTEYLYVNGKWEIIGSRRIESPNGAADLTGYATEQWVQDGYQPKGNYLTEVPDGYAKTEDIPKKAADVGALPDTYTPPNQTAEQVGADPKGTAATAVSQHNTDAAAHNDLRVELKALADRINAFFDSDDQTLDELSEIVAYITSNKALIEAITTSKVSVADIINNLTTNVANKPLSAAQGVVLKGLIDTVSNSLSGYAKTTDISAHNSDKAAHADIREQLSQLSSEKVDESQLTSAVNAALAEAKESGEFDGADGYTPVRGVDYWTPEDIAAIDADIATELAKRGQLKPEFAESLEWLETNGDQTMLYVLPDGMIYAYMLTEKEVEGGASYTNVLPLATDTDRGTIYGGDYDGDGVNDGYNTATRLSSSSGSPTSSKEAMCASGFISATTGATLRIKDLDVVTDVSSYVISYDSSMAMISYQNFLILVGTTGYYGGTWLTADAENKLLTIELTSANFGDDVAFIRFSGGITENTIATINEEIKEGGTTIVTEYAWSNTGHALIPADYEDRIIALEKKDLSHTARIVALEKAVTTGGVDETEAAALTRIKVWDKPVYDPAPVTLLSDDRAKPALTTSDRTIDAIYAKYRSLMAQYPRNITETNLGPCTSSSTFGAVDILRFDIKEPDGLTQSDLGVDALHETKPKIIFMSGVHNEWVGVWGLYYAIEEIVTNPDFDDVRRNAHIIVVPCANPYGLTKPLGEYSAPSHVNANGIAIHNNFGVGWKSIGNVGEYNYGGTEPYSELETQYIDAVMAENPDAVAFVSCHNNDYSTYYGSHVIWASSATYHMCNVAFRLIDKLSKAWLDKYGDTLRDAIDAVKINMDAGDYRLGRATISSSAGTEQLNATKYGIQATNLEISRMMKVFSGDTDGSSEVMTHGAEVYANFMRTLLWSYDHKDKTEYAPNLPWSE